MKRIKTILKRLILGRYTATPDPYTHPQIQVGHHTYGLTPFTIRIFTLHDRVVIGNFCSISRNVKILASGQRYHGRVSNYSFVTHMIHGDVTNDLPVNAPVSIGHDVWIGTGAIILPGVAIGNGAIVGAGAVVAKRVDDYSIVGGVPARLIRYRFDEKCRRQLMEIAWWNWTDEVILSRLDHFYGDIDEFIRLYGSSFKEDINSD